MFHPPDGGWYPFINIYNAVIRSSFTATPTAGRVVVPLSIQMIGSVAGATPRFIPGLSTNKTEMSRRAVTAETEWRDAGSCDVIVTADR